MDLGWLCHQAICDRLHDVYLFPEVISKAPNSPELESVRHEEETLCKICIFDLALAFTPNDLPDATLRFSRLGISSGWGATF